MSSLWMVSIIKGVQLSGGRSACC